MLCFVFVLACFPKVSKDHRKLEGVVTGIFIKSFVAAHALWRVGTRSPRKGTPNTTQSSQVRGPRGTPPPRPGERRKGSPPRPTGRVAGCAPTPAAFTRAGSARSRRPPRHDAPWPRRQTRVQRRHGLSRGPARPPCLCASVQAMISTHPAPPQPLSQRSRPTRCPPSTRRESGPRASS